MVEVGALRLGSAGEALIGRIVGWRENVLQGPAPRQLEVALVPQEAHKVQCAQFRLGRDQEGVGAVQRMDDAALGPVETVGQGADKAEDHHLRIALGHPPQGWAGQVDLHRREVSDDRTVVRRRLSRGRGLGERRRPERYGGDCRCYARDLSHAIPFMRPLAEADRGCGARRRAADPQQRKAR